MLTDLSGMGAVSCGSLRVAAAFAQNIAADGLGKVLNPNTLFFIEKS